MCLNSYIVLCQGENTDMLILDKNITAFDDQNTTCVFVSTGTEVTYLSSNLQGHQSA